MKIPRPVVRGVFFTTVLASLLFAGRVWPTQPARAADAPALAFVAPNAPTDRQPEVYQGNFSETSIAQILADKHVTVDPADKIYAFPNPALGVGSTVEVYRASVVQLTDANVTSTVHTWSKTVADLAVEQNFQLGDTDSITPPLTTVIPADGTVLDVTITRVSQTDVTEEQTIPYATQTDTSVNLQKGQSQIVTKGVAGQEEVIYLVTRTDGVETAKVLVSSTVVRAPVTEVVTVGIGPKLTTAGPYEDLINAAAKKYLIDGTALHCLMMAESNGHANDSGLYEGLFQYTDGYWSSASASAGYAGASIYDPTAQIFTTAWALTHGQSGRWPTWPPCRNL